MSTLRTDVSTLRSDVSTLRTDLKAVEQRLEARISEEVRGSERRMVDLLNDRFDAVMEALDRRDNPPG
jgi:outer membrane murein-binding lipoprotein Lpp